MQAANRYARLERPLLAVLGVCVWLTLLTFPVPLAGVSLDAGWAVGLGHFLKTRQQAGVDYAFTFGPLGYLMSRAYFPGLFWLKYGWAIVFSGATSWLVVRTMMHLPSRWLWFPWMAVILEVLPDQEVAYVVLVLGAATLHILDRTWSRRRLASTAAMLAVLALIKFTYLALGVTAVVATVISAPATERRRVAIELPSFFVGGVLFFWLIAGQSPLNLPRFLSTSIEIARGYSEAMRAGDAGVRFSAAIETLLFVAAGVLILPPRAHLSIERVAGMGLVALGFFFAFKEGFVREDRWHEASFFEYAAIAVFFVAALDRGRHPDTAALRGAFLAVAGIVAVSALESTREEQPTRWSGLTRVVGRWEANSKALVAPAELERSLEATWKIQHEQAALPAVRARVGNQTIDVATFDNVLVFWNDFNWRQRPLFQSYVAYTPSLARKNRDFLRGPAAPHYVLVSWAAIDLRFPAHEDPLYFIELLRRYHPVLDERGYTLFERRQTTPQSGDEKGRVVVHRNLKFGERLALSLDPAKLSTLAIRFHPSAACRLRRFLYRMPLPHLIAQVNGSRTPERFNLLPELSLVGFLINPFFASQADFPRIYGGTPRTIRSVRLELDDEGAACFGRSATIMVTEYPGIPKVE